MIAVLSLMISGTMAMCETEKSERLGKRPFEVGEPAKGREREKLLQV